MLKAFKDAFRGIAEGFRSERNMRIHGVAALFALAACAILQVERWAWCVVLLCIAAVIAAELFNTSIERLCDKVSPEKDDNIRISKDTAAGAVLVWAIIAVILACVIYIPALCRLIA